MAPTGGEPAPEAAGSGGDAAVAGVAGLAAAAAAGSGGEAGASVHAWRVVSSPFSSGSASGCSCGCSCSSSTTVSIASASSEPPNAARILRAWPTRTPASFRSSSVAQRRQLTSSNPAPQTKKQFSKKRRQILIQNLNDGNAFAHRARPAWMRRSGCSSRSRPRSPRRPGGRC